MRPTARAEAQAAWALRPLLAARNSVRLWNAATGYDRARRAGRRLPSQPAAAPIFDRTGRTRLLVLDFDPTEHGREQVVRDCEQALAWIAEARGRAIVDESTRGGRHVLVPLHPVADFAVRHLRPLLEELARRLPTLDITPMTNPASGCITMPGSVCREGGHRRLITPLEQALEIAEHRSPQGTMARLNELLAVNTSVARPAADGAPAELGSGESEVVAVSTVRDLPATVADFAVAGVLPDRRNARGERWTRHEARQSVLAHAALRGLSPSEVRAKAVAGEWAGLRAAYDRYGPGWERMLNSDWKKALTWAKAAGLKFRVSAHKKVHTGGAVRLRQWWARAERWTMLCSELEGQTRWTVLALWQAFAYGAQLNNSTNLALGRRWLSVAAGLLADETVSAGLRVLREMPGSPIILVEKGTGTNADRYALVTARINGEDVPAEPKAVQRLRIAPVHPAWAVVGLAARRVLEAVESIPGHARPQELPERTGMSTTQVYEAIGRLTEHGLLTRGHGWVRRTTRTLEDVAVTHDVAALREQRIARHRAERVQWHALLAQWSGEVATDCPAAERLPSDPWGPQERADYLVALLATGPPPADPRDDLDLDTDGGEETQAVDLLVNLFGARVLEITPVTSSCR